MASPSGVSSSYWNAPSAYLGTAYDGLSILVDTKNREGTYRGTIDLPSPSAGRRELDRLVFQVMDTVRQYVRAPDKSASSFQVLRIMLVYSTKPLSYAHLLTHQDLFQKTLRSSSLLTYYTETHATSHPHQKHSSRNAGWRINSVGTILSPTQPCSSPSPLDLLIAQERIWR